MKRFRHRGMVVLGTLAILATLATLTPLAKGAEDEKRARIVVLTDPFGAGIYEIWTNFERIFEKNHPWLRVVAQETPGFVYQIKEMSINKKRWKRVMFGSNFPILSSAEHAIKPFFDKAISSKPWKFVYPLSGVGATTWFWVTLDPNIKSMKDFEGKKLGLGLRGQVNWGLWPTVAMDVLGVKAKLDYLGPYPALQAMLDGRVDVSQVNSSIPYVQPAEGKLKARPFAVLQKLLAANRKFYYIDYDNNWVEKMKQERGYTIAKSWKVEAGTLPKQDRDLIGVHPLPSGWTVHESFPEEIIYEFTKFMIKNGTKLKRYSKQGDFFVTPKGFATKLGFNENNTHPGSIKAFKEAGAWD